MTTTEAVLELARAQRAAVGERAAAILADVHRYDHAGVAGELVLAQAMLKSIARADQEYEEARCSAFECYCAGVAAHA